MTIDFTNANTSPVRRLTFPDASLTGSASTVWSVLIIAQHVLASGDFRYMFSTGPIQTGRFNLWIGDLMRISSAYSGTVNVWSSGPAQTISDGDWFLLYYSWAQSPGPSAAHSGRMCKLGSGRIDSYFDTSVAAVLTSGGTSYIGARADLSDTREWHGKCSDVIIFHDCLISDTDLIAIANGGVAMDELPFWRYRKFHFDGLYDPRVSSGATDLVSGIPVTTNGSGYGADIYDPPFVRRYSQQRNGKFFSFDFSAGSQPDLSADAVAQAAAAGELSTQIPIAGATVVVATASGAISTSIDLSGAAVSASIAAADIITGIPLAGDAAGQSISTGALQSDAPELAGDATGQATATADMTTTITLSGAAIAQAIAAAGIDTSILLAGGASAQSDATGDLGGAAQLSGNAASNATATGDLTIQIQLSAAAVAQALATGSLNGGPVQLVGNAAGQSSASAELTTQIQLDADAAAVATGTGQFTASDVPLAGNAVAIASGAGDLNTQINLTGAALNLVSATGDLTVFLGISGHAAALAAAGADITTQIPLNAAAVAQALASANLTGGISTIKPNPAYTVRGLWRDYRVAA